jgi:hypothetical protein
MKHWKLKIYLVSREFFQFSLLTYLLLLLTETLSEGFVSLFFNLNILLVVILFCGIISLVTYDNKLALPHKKKINYAKSAEYSIFMGIMGALLVFYKTQDLGPVSLTIAIITAVIISILSFLLLTDK